ncbi:hypothetical protein [Methylobacterium sp. Leaf125]|nr:hypothetical protein [Methylobacterium sp. Leaf125]
MISTFDLAAMLLTLSALFVRRQMIWDIQRCSGAEALVHLG